MEKLRDDKQEDKLRSSTAIRCAKAAILLSSLKSGLCNSASEDISEMQDDDLEVQRLKVELVKLKLKLKKLRIFVGLWLVLYNICILVLLFPVALKLF